jgi:hypothetical protein
VVGADLSTSVQERRGNLLVQVNYNLALEIFEAFPTHCKSAYLHPFYVFADASRDLSLKPVFWVYEEDESIFYHGFHLAKIADTSYYDIQSPYGYGGAISSSEDPSFLNSAWSAYNNWCKEQQVLAEFIRFHPLLYNHRLYNGEVICDRDTVFVDLSSHDLMSNCAPRTRTAIRKAIKNGLTVEWAKPEQSWQDFQSLYNSTMKDLGAESFYFFPETYHHLILNWDKANLVVCKLSDGSIGAAAVFLNSSHIMEYHLGASTQLGKTSGAMLLLMHTVSLKAQGLGYKFLYLGGGTNHESDNSLLFFKSRFSNLREPFQIGKQIFYPDIYNIMKQEWQLKHSSASNRVLFYR